MPLKIICVEEHTIDAALAKATQPALARKAPYMADLGSRYQDPHREDGGQPRIQSPDRVNKLAAAHIEDRLPDMDAHGIDVQVLSYSNATQEKPSISHARRITGWPRR